MRFKLALILILTMALTFFAYLVMRPMQPRKGGRVEIRKQNGRYQLYKNGSPFFIKGGAGFENMKTLVACGGNTLRTWDTTNLKEILDEADRNKLSVIVGLDLPPADNIKNFYGDRSKTTALISKYRQLVHRFRDHPAVLAWCLGNELSFSFSPGESSFYETLENLIREVHEEDHDHPITTTVINRSKIAAIKLRIPRFDFLSINTFATIKRIGRDLSDISWFWRGPYLISEWAPLGSWEAESTAWQAPVENTSTKTAELVSDYYKHYMPINDGRVLGNMIFYWGSKEEDTHTWFSIFDEKGEPTEIVEAISDCWKDTVTRHLAPAIEYLLLDKKGARENILVTPGSSHYAQLVLPASTDSNSLHYSWEVIREDWWCSLEKIKRKPPAETGLITDTLPAAILFDAPTSEGPYRIFVTVRNNYGFIATANIPFYVVK